MRVIIFAKSSPGAEAMEPTPEGMEAMGRFHQELMDAGVLLASERLHSSDRGAKVRFEGKAKHVTDGPFTETKELVAGYWVWKVDSLEHAIKWLSRAPFDGGEFEIREIAEMPAMVEAG